MDGMWCEPRQGHLLSATRHFTTAHVRTLMMIRKNQKWLPSQEAVQKEYLGKDEVIDLDKAAQACLAKKQKVSEGAAASTSADTSTSGQ